MNVLSQMLSNMMSGFLYYAGHGESLHLSLTITLFIIFLKEDIWLKSIPIRSSLISGRS